MRGLTSSRSAASLSCCASTRSALGFELRGVRGGLGAGGGNGAYVDDGVARQVGGVEGAGMGCGRDDGGAAGGAAGGVAGGGEDEGGVGRVVGVGRGGGQVAGVGGGEGLARGEGTDTEVDHLRARHVDGSGHDEREGGEEEREDSEASFSRAHGEALGWDKKETAVEGVRGARRPSAVGGSARMEGMRSGVCLHVGSGGVEWSRRRLLRALSVFLPDCAALGRQQSRWSLSGSGAAAVRPRRADSGGRVVSVECRSLPSPTRVGASLGVAVSPLRGSGAEDRPLVDVGHRAPDHVRAASPGRA